MQDLTSITHESLLLEVRKQIPLPVKTESQLDGTIVLTGGKPGEVIVRINDDEISIAVFAIRWDGPHTPVVNSRDLAKFNWNCCLHHRRSKQFRDSSAPLSNSAERNTVNVSSVERQHRQNGCTTSGFATRVPNSTLESSTDDRSSDNEPTFGSSDTNSFLLNR